MKLVSILIPAYKPGHFRECLTSALAQTWSNREIIVSDDCPSDAIRRICEDYAGGITYVRNPDPGALGRNNMRHLCRLSRGEYLKFLADDDVLDPSCVQCLVEALEATAGEQTMLAFSPRAVIDGESRSGALINEFGVRKLTVIPGSHVIARMARDLRNPIGEFTTTLFRRADVVDAEGTPLIFKVESEEWPGLGDVATWINLARRGNVVAHPKVLSRFRLHMASKSNPAVNPNFVNVVRDWRKVLDLASEQELLTSLERLRSRAKLIAVFLKWLRTYPELRYDIWRVVCGRKSRPL